MQFHFQRPNKKLFLHKSTKIYQLIVAMNMVMAIQFLMIQHVAGEPIFLQKSFHAFILKVGDRSINLGLRGGSKKIRKSTVSSKRGAPAQRNKNYVSRDVRDMAPPIDDSDEQDKKPKRVWKRTGKLLRERLTWKNPYVFGKKLSLRQARSVRSELDVARTCRASLERMQWIQQSARPRAKRPAPRIEVAPKDKFVSDTKNESTVDTITPSLANKTHSRFIPAPYFNGDIHGFKFRSGSLGTGYYAIRHRKCAVEKATAQVSSMIDMGSVRSKCQRLIDTLDDDSSKGPPAAPAPVDGEALSEADGAGSSELEDRLLRGEVPLVASQPTVSAPIASERGRTAAAAASCTTTISLASSGSDALDLVRVAGTGETLREWLSHHPRSPAIRPCAP